MESFLPLPRSAGRAPSRRAAASLAAQFQMLTLEDRVVPSSSIPLNGVGFKPLGPALIDNAVASQDGLSTAGRVNGIYATPIPFDPSNPGATGPTDPTDPAYPLFNTYFAATPGGGVARTTDSGRTWQFLTDNMPLSSWGNLDQNRTLSVGAVGVSPQDRNLVFAGTGEGFSDGLFSYAGHGVLRSTDGGETWSLNKGPNNAFEGATFKKFVFHPQDRNVVYAIANGGGGSGVYRTTDAGNTWTLVTANSGSGQRVTDFILNPSTPNVGYVGIENFGVIRTANLQVGTFPTATYTTPAAGQFSFILGGTGTQLPGGSFGQFRLAFGLGTPSQPSRIYALVISPGGATTQLYRTDDSGTNVRRLDPFPGTPGTDTPRPTNQFGVYNTVLLADPTNPARVFIGGRGAGSVQVLLNADYDPDTQQPVYVNLTANFPPSPGDNFATIRDMQFDNTGAKDVNGRALDPGRLVIATDSGVYRLQAPNNGVTTIGNFLSGNVVLTDLNGVPGLSALNNQQVFATGLPPRDDNRLLAGTYLNGSALFVDGGPIAPTDPGYPGLFTWDAVTSQTTGGVRGSGGNVIYNQLDPNRAFRASNPNGFGTAIGGLFQRSVDGGISFDTSVAGIVNPGALYPVVPLEADPSPQVGTLDAKLYLGTDTLNISTDDGRSWGQYGPDVNFVKNLGPRLTAVANGRASALPIYVAMNYRQGPSTTQGPGIYRWDGGNAWRDVSPGTANHLLAPTPGGQVEPEPNQLIGIVTDLTVDPTNSSIVYMVCDTPGVGGGPELGGRRVWRTTNGGETWADISGDLPATLLGTPGVRVYSVALDPQRTNINPNNPGDPVNQSDDDVYLGTTAGVYKLTNPTASTAWTRLFGTGGGQGSTGTDFTSGSLPDAVVRDVKLNTTTGVLSVATFGRGVWQTQIRPYIRGLVFDDRTGNGTFDPTVPGVPPAPDAPGDLTFPGAVVVANDIVPNPQVQFANTTAAANGEYVFRSLPTSTYSFLPADASTKYVDPASRYYFTSNPIVAALNPTSTVTGQDLYLFRRVSISGQVYEDANGDGAFQPNENPAVGYTVQLVAPKGTLDPNQPTVLATVTTGIDGKYTFLGVGPLRDAAVGPATPFASGYQVVLSKANYQSTETPAPTGVLISGVNLTDAANQNLTRIGAFRLGQLSGTIFEDGNGDGALNNAEPGLAGVTVNVIDLATNKLVAATVSAADGSYLFGDLLTTLRAGSYTIQVVDKAGFVRTTPQFDPIAVQSGTKSTGLNIGLFAAATVFGNAFEDVNANGVRDPGDTTPFPGVTISLIDPRTNGVVASAVTDGNGNYAFGGLFPLDLNGNKTPYLVRLTSPADFLAETVFDPAVTLSSGATKFADLPLFVRTTVTGFAFEDTNGNGVRDGGEQGLAGGTVSLLNANTGAVVLSTLTDGGGTYTFTGVGPIVGPVPYRVGANPAGAVQTTPNPPDFLVTSGVPVTVTQPIGLFRLARFSGTLFDDANGNGVLDGGEFPLPGRVVQLVDAGTGAVVATAATDGGGNYALSAGAGTFFVRLAATDGFAQTTPPPAPVTTTSGQTVTGQNFGLFQLTTVTGFVYNDLNGNSIRDSDPGLGNVLVELVSTATNAVVASATTDATGFFTITGVGPGSYAVRAALGGGLVASTPAVQNFTAASATPTTFSFGAYFPTTVSGFVYEDLNRSNGFNAGDIPSAGWTVQLTRPGGILAGTALTDAAGNVSFGNLAPGSYTARVLNRQGFAVLNNGTQVVSVVSGTPVILAPVGVLKLGSLSGSLFLDSNRNGRFDGFERGLAGGTVQLVDGNGRVAATATTDAAGFYTFLGLQTGAYSVRLTAAPPGFALSPTGATTLNATTTVGSPNPDNAVTGLNFGLVGRKRYALAADGGGGPRVQVYDAQSNALLNDFFVYETQFTGGVRVAEADVNGDGVDDLIVVPGKGGGPRVRVLSGSDGAELYNYFAYEPSFTDGLYVTAGDVDGDGFADIITGTDSGGGPRVTVFSGKSGLIIADYFAYDSAFRGGVRVGSADTDGDGVAEILTAPGIGGPPTVKVFGGGNFRELNSFAAFDPSYTGGLFLAATTTNLQTGNGDIIVGSGMNYPSAPVVRVFNGRTLGLQSEFEAFPGDYRSEVRVASFDRNGDNVPDIAVASGAGTPSRIRFVDGLNFRQLGDEIQPYETAFLGGIFIG